MDSCKSLTIYIFNAILQSVEHLSANYRQNNCKSHMKKFLSIVAVTTSAEGLNPVSFSDISELKEQNDPEKMNNEIVNRVNWFISGAAMRPPCRLISVSHSIFSM